MLLDAYGNGGTGSTEPTPRAEDPHEEGALLEGDGEHTAPDADWPDAAPREPAVPIETPEGRAVNRARRSVSGARVTRHVAGIDETPELLSDAAGLFRVGAIPDPNPWHRVVLPAVHEDQSSTLTAEFKRDQTHESHVGTLQLASSHRLTAWVEDARGDLPPLTLPTLELYSGSAPLPSTAA